MAAFSDNLLKKSIVGLSTQEVDKELNAIVRLFCCLHDRDVFIKSLEVNLHVRLLNKTIASKEAEEQIIAKI